MTSGYLCILLFQLLHPIYLSTCKIQIDEQRQWQATFRIFYDDLEDGIQNMQGIRPNLDTNSLHRYEHYMLSYLQKHFEIWSITESLPIKIESAERLADVIILTVSGKTMWPDHEVQLRLDLLTEIFPQQKNIVQVHYSQLPIIYRSLDSSDNFLIIPRKT